MRTRFRTAASFVSIIGLVLGLSANILQPQLVHAALGTNTRISDGYNGLIANAGSSGGALSNDGRFAVFVSSASNLVPGDTNNAGDIFLRNLTTSTTSRISMGFAGTQANAHSGAPMFSANGRYIVYGSNATNLVPNDNNGYPDIFRYNIETGTTELVSVSASGAQANQSNFSPDVDSTGDLIVFGTGSTNLSSTSDSNGINDDVVLKDMQTGTVTYLSKSALGVTGNDRSGAAKISCDGRYVTFSSKSDNLVPNDNNGYTDVFLADTQGVQPLANLMINANHVSEPYDISCDGKYILFYSPATNLGIDPYPGASDVFRYNSSNGAIEAVSTRQNGSVPIQDSYGVAMSNDGRYVIFAAAGSTFLTSIPDTNSDTDLFLRDMNSTGFQLISQTPGGQVGNFYSIQGNFSATNRIIFTSRATNLVNTGPNDNNGQPDIFVTDFGVSDTTPPAITGIPDRSANQNGWYNADVIIDWTSADPLPNFGVPTDPPNTVASTEGQSVIYTSQPSCDVAGNCATGSINISLDKTAPTITAELSNVPNSNGWNSSDTTVTFVCDDNLSGIDSCPGPTVVSTEAANQEVTGTATDKAGNSKSITLFVNLDKTTPTIEASVLPLLNVYGWSNTDVTVSYQCNDLLSLIDFCSGTHIFSAEGANQSILGVAIDRAGNTAQVSTTVSIDKTNPLISLSALPLPNTDGWNNSDVDVSFSCDDLLSGVLTCASPVNVSIETPGQTVTGQATDKAGNNATATTTIKLDKTRPTITANLTPLLNQYGWANSDITIEYACSDALSGVRSCSSNQIISSEGANQTATGQVVDNADNSNDVATSFGIDKTAPTITASVSSAPNANGWNNSDITVTFACTDALSGVDSCSAPVTLTTEGNGQTVTGTVVDRAGNINTVMAVVNIDKTKPTLAAVISPAPNSNGWNNTNSTITFTCNDSLSGISSCTNPITLTTEGINQSVSGTALDNAGNSNTLTTTVNIDKTLPLVNSLALSRTFMLFFQPVNITAGVTDALSGIDSSQSGEYFIDTDPGAGNGIPMTYSGGNLAATISSSPGNGTHTVNVRTKDKAGNWSTVRTANMTILL